MSLLTTAAPASALTDLAPTTALAAEHLGCDVIAACPFSRRGFTVNRIVGRFGFIPLLFAHLYQRKQAGGLPMRFVIAVTADKVHAISYMQSGFSPRMKLRNEVAVFDRTALTVSVDAVKTGGLLYDVTLTAGDKVMQCTVGKAACSDAFLALLSDPSR